MAAPFLQCINLCILLIDKGFHKARSLFYHVLYFLDVTTIFPEISSLFTRESHSYFYSYFHDIWTLMPSFSTWCLVQYNLYLQNLHAIITALIASSSVSKHIMIIETLYFSIMYRSVFLMGHLYVHKVNK